jgi:hypothetical protein
MGRNGLNCSDSGKRPVVGSCEHSNEALGLMKCCEVLGLYNCLPLEKG